MNMKVCYLCLYCDYDISKTKDQKYFIVTRAQKRMPEPVGHLKNRS